LPEEVERRMTNHLMAEQEKQKKDTKKEKKAER
jgi:hypothetical protein